ncbi:hypothetical protein CcaverHIS641_0101820 [Cutaneotrichosporon cavernicola]|nr:hypothetical protein CcaverHIS641_0101820 [Cutaneotrichosporon cavernicola]
MSSKRPHDGDDNIQPRQRTRTQTLITIPPEHLEDNHLPLDGHAFLFAMAWSQPGLAESTAAVTAQILQNNNQLSGPLYRHSPTSENLDSELDALAKALTTLDLSLKRANFIQRDRDTFRRFDIDDSALMHPTEQQLSELLDAGRHSRDILPDVRDQDISEGLRASPDQQHQVHRDSHGEIAAVGHHSVGNVEMLSTIDKLGKAGLLPETFALFKLAIHLWQSACHSETIAPSSVSQNSVNGHHTMHIACLLHYTYHLNAQSSSTANRNVMSHDAKAHHIEQREAFHRFLYQGDETWLNNLTDLHGSEAPRNVVMSIGLKPFDKALAMFCNNVPTHGLRGYLNRVRGIGAFRTARERIELVYSKLPSFTTEVLQPLWSVWSVGSQVPFGLTYDGVPALFFKTDEKGEWREASDIRPHVDSPDPHLLERTAPQPGLVIAELLCALKIEYETECDKNFPPNPANSELGILAHMLRELATRGVYEATTDTILVLDSATGLPMLLNGSRHYPLSTTSNAHGNHSLPLHFGFTNEWPHDPQEYHLELLNVKMESWYFNRYIAFWRISTIELAVEATRGEEQQLNDGLAQAGVCPQQVLPTFRFGRQARQLLLRTSTEAELAYVWPQMTAITATWGESFAQENAARNTFRREQLEALDDQLHQVEQERRLASTQQEALEATARLANLGHQRELVAGPSRPRPSVASGGAANPLGLLGRQLDAIRARAAVAEREDNKPAIDVGKFLVDRLSTASQSYRWCHVCFAVNGLRTEAAGPICSACHKFATGNNRTENARQPLSYIVKSLFNGKQKLRMAQRAVSSLLGDLDLYSL